MSAADCKNSLQPTGTSLRNCPVISSILSVAEAKCFDVDNDSLSSPPLSKDVRKAYAQETSFTLRV